MKKEFKKGYHKVIVPENVDLVLKKQYNNLPFGKVDRLNTKYSESAGDLLDLMGALSKPSRDLFLVIKCNMNWKTNVAQIPKTTSPAESVTRYRALKALKEHNLVRNIRRNVFMISPYYLVPAPGNMQESIIANWELLT